MKFFTLAAFSTVWFKTSIRQSRLTRDQ